MNKSGQFWDINRMKPDIPRAQQREKWFDPLRDGGQGATEALARAGRTAA